MSNLLFKEKIRGDMFGGKLIDMFGHDKLTARPYSENAADEHGNPVVNRMTLYYVDTPEAEIPTTHVGTWMKGEGWIFKHADKFRIDKLPATKDKK